MQPPGNTRLPSNAGSARNVGTRADGTVLGLTYRVLQRLRVYQHTGFSVWELGDRTDIVMTAHNSALAFYGINGLRRTGDAAQVEPLGLLYQEFVNGGDDGIVATLENRLVGHAWVRHGPYVENAGCGRVRIPPHVQVVRYLEIRPEHQGEGHGRAVLAELTKRIGRPRDRVVALIAFGNERSERCFQALGIVASGTCTLGNPWSRTSNQAPAMRSRLEAIDDRTWELVAGETFELPITCDPGFAMAVCLAYAGAIVAWPYLLKSEAAEELVIAYELRSPGMPRMTLSPFALPCAIGRQVGLRPLAQSYVEIERALSIRYRSIYCAFHSTSRVSHPLAGVIH